MFSIGQSVRVEYVGGPPLVNVHPDLIKWWTRSYDAEVLSVDDDHIVVKDLDDSDDLIVCKCTIWNNDSTIQVHRRDK